VTLFTTKPDDRVEDAQYYYALRSWDWWDGDFVQSDETILYDGKFTLKQATHITSVAVRDGWLNSDITDVNFYDGYYLNHPEFGWDSSTRELTFSAAEGATVYYTLDGSDPNTSETRKKYESAITLTRNVNVKAIATMPEHFNSEIHSFGIGDVYYPFEIAGVWYRMADYTTEPEVYVCRPGNDGAYSGAVTVPATITIPAAVDVVGTTCTVTGIAGDAFRGFTELTSVTLDNELTYIPVEAFRDCTGLISVTLPSTVNYIDDYAFYNCTSLSGDWTFPAGMTYVGYQAFYATAINALTIQPTPDEKKYVTAWTSTNHNDNSSSEATITISTEAGSSLSFNWSVSSEGGCDYLRIYLDEQEIVSASGEESNFYSSEAFSEGGVHTLRVSYSKDGSANSGLDTGGISDISGVKEAYVLSSIQIREYAFQSSGVKSVDIQRVDVNIHNEAFRDCNSIESVKLNTRTVGSWFSGKGSIKEVTFGDAVQTIGNNAFNSCTALENIILPSTLTTIGAEAFRQCHLLKAITLPSSVTSIGYCAFWDCENLTSVFAQGSTPPTFIDGTTEVFSNISNATLYVPEGSEGTYQSADVWKDFSSIQTFSGDMPCAQPGDFNGMGRRRYA